MKTNLFKLLSCAAALAATGNHASADINLAVDLEGSNGGASVTETGFVSLSADGASVVGATFSTSETYVNATIGATGVAGFLAGRDGDGNDRGGDLSNLTQPDLHGELVAARGGDGGFTIQLTGLTIGEDYTVTAWHNDANGAGTGFATPGDLVTPSITGGGAQTSATNGEHTNFSRPETTTFSGPYEDSDLKPSTISFTASATTADILLSSAAVNGFNPVSGFTVDGPALPDPPDPEPDPDTGILLAVDFEGTTGSPVTQADWVSLLAANGEAPGVTASTAEAGVNVEIGATGGGFLAGRGGAGQDRGGDLSNLTHSDVHGDLIAVRGGDGGMSVQITGLTIGETVIFTAWHNDANGGNPGFSGEAPGNNLPTPLFQSTTSIVSGATLISATNGELNNLSRPGVPTFSGPYEDSDLTPSVITFTVDASTVDLLLSSDSDFLDGANPVSGITVSVPVIETVPTLVITQNVNGTDLDFSWNSTPRMLYDLLSATDLSTNPSTWPPVGGNVGIPADGSGTNMLTIPRPADPRTFYVVDEYPAPPMSIFSTDFEADDGGFSFVDASGGAGTPWERGTPDSDNGFGSTVTSGNGESANAWATNLGDISGTADEGFFNTSTDGALVSPIIPLGGLTEATLNFAQALDLDTGDTAVINFLNSDDSDNNVGSIVVTDGATDSSPWEARSIPIPGTALDKNVKIEWRLTSGGLATGFIGWYIDDVVVTTP